jgi:hypothetical protein
MAAANPCADKCTRLSQTSAAATWTARCRRRLAECLVVGPFRIRRHQLFHKSLSMIPSPLLRPQPADARAARASTGRPAAHPSPPNLRMPEDVIGDRAGESTGQSRTSKKIQGDHTFENGVERASVEGIPPQTGRRELAERMKSTIEPLGLEQRPKTAESSVGVSPHQPSLIGLQADESVRFLTG